MTGSHKQARRWIDERVVDIKEDGRRLTSKASRRASQPGKSIMPQTDSPVPPAKAARTENPADGRKPGGRLDRVREAFVEAAQIVMRQQPSRAARDINTELEARLTTLVKGSDPNAENDPCRSSARQNPQIAGFCFTREQAHDQARFTCVGSEEDASTTLETAKRTWTRALEEYDFTMRSANSALDQAKATAIAAFDLENNQDSVSRQNYLHYTQKQQIASALLTFEGGAASAGTKLAGALATLLAAYQSWLAAIQAAASQRLDDYATAEQTFWQSVEGVPDS